MLAKKSNHSSERLPNQLSQVINMDHPLVRLSELIDWNQIEDRIDPLCHLGLGQPPPPSRLPIGLHYLKHAFNLSDEQVIIRWCESICRQYFCGNDHFQTDPPPRPATLVEWRNRAGSNLEIRLENTLQLAQKIKAMSN